MRKTWTAGAAATLVLAGATFIPAQSQDPAPMGFGMISQGGQGGMMDRGGMMGGGMMGQSGQGGMMGPGMMGQPTQEQLEAIAKQHGMTVEQATQMTALCHQMMSQAPAGTGAQQQ